MRIRQKKQREEGKRSRFGDRFSHTPLRAADVLLRDPAGIAFLGVGVTLFAGATAFRLWRARGRGARRRSKQQSGSS
ncbi:hypothetical protein BH23CHL2_BH23CHL2_08440 [soil metagenome]